MTKTQKTAVLFWEDFYKRIFVCVVFQRFLFEIVQTALTELFKQQKIKARHFSIISDEGDNKLSKIGLCVQINVIVESTPFLGEKKDISLYDNQKTTSFESHY